MALCNTGICPIMKLMTPAGDMCASMGMCYCYDAHAGSQLGSLSQKEHTRHRPLETFFLLTLPPLQLCESALEPGAKHSWLVAEEEDQHSHWSLELCSLNCLLC